MALEVIGAGFGRTGTLSLKQALEELGFGPCHHMTEIIADVRRQGPLWNAVATGKERDWDKVFAGYRSTVDWPGCRYYAELAEQYPGAKVILTVRDPRQWYASMKETIFGGPVWGFRIVSAVIRHPMWFTQAIVHKGTFGFDLGEANAVAAYERHNQDVQERIDPERLLVFDVRQGWEPLCAFLGVAVPATPFPRVNDREQFKQHGKDMREAMRRR
jgi:hypothetical protein